MSLHAANSSPTIGDLRSTIRLLQRRLNLIEHLCDEADNEHATTITVTTIRTALRSTT